jgi:hypothetical protein
MNTKQIIDELTKKLNKQLNKMPDDKARQRALDELSNRMFCGKVEKKDERK